jgi:hypothetical protein
VLHIYNGKVKLSFWSESASNSAETATPTKYRAVYSVEFRQSICLSKKFTHTENGSADPTRRSSQADDTIDTTNASDPSTVFDVVGDHRWIPTRFPTTDACGEAHPSTSNITPSRKKTYNCVTNA